MTRTALELALLSLVTASWLAACNPENEVYPSGSSRPVAPVPLGSTVAYLDGPRASAFIIDPAGASLQARPVPVGRSPVAALARAGRAPQDAELLVLSQGVTPQRGHKPEAPMLTAIPADAARPTRQFPLSSRFDGIAQSGDGRFAVLHFVRGSNPDSSLLFNPNEVAVLDLDAPPPATPASRSLRSFGSVPQAVVFSPPLPLRADGMQAARMLRLAVVLSDNTLTLLDLENDRTEITISLIRADETRTVKPVQVLFDASDPAQDPTIFVRSDGSNDIVALRLLPAPPPRAERANDFRPVLSLLGASAAPTDMALFANAGVAGDTGARLLVLSPSTSEASVIDPRTSRVTTFKLDAPAQQLLLFEAASPAEPTRRPRALLLAAGGAQIGFLDLDRLEELRGRNLELRSMASKTSQFVPLVERGVVVAHNGSGSGGLSVIDLERRTVAPLVTEPLHQLRPGAATTDDLWLVPNARDRLGLLHLGRLVAEEVRLDLPVESVLPLAATAGGKRYVAVDHGQPAGGVTLLDADEPAREGARSLVGFLYTDILSREIP
jgi:hypothetical protein